MTFAAAAGGSRAAEVERLTSRGDARAAAAASNCMRTALGDFAYAQSNKAAAEERSQRGSVASEAAGTLFQRSWKRNRF